MRKPSQSAGYTATGRRRTPGIATLLLTILLALSPAVPAQETLPNPEREVGRNGWEFPSANLWLGGYATARFRNLAHESARADLRDLSLLGEWTPSTRWLVFGEFELEQGLTVDNDGLSTSDAELAVERLYAEYATRTGLTFRAGKFLTPIGNWNELHADPLVATVSRPLATSLPFASNSTGVAARGALQLRDGNTLDYILYADWSEALDPGHDNSGHEDLELPDRDNAFHDAVGAQMRLHAWNNRLELGWSVAQFRIHGEDHRNLLLGLDLRADIGALALSGEAFYRHGNGTAADEWGGFVQAIVPIKGGLATVARLERYDGRTPVETVDLATVGLLYQGLPPLVMKFEYRRGDDNRHIADNGVLASISLLF